MAISYILGLFGVYPFTATADSIRLHSFRLPNRGDVAILDALVLFLKPTNGYRCDVTLSGIIVLYSGFYFEFNFGLYSDLSPPVPPVPVLAGPPNNGDTGFSPIGVFFHCHRRVPVAFPPMQGH